MRRLFLGAATLAVLLSSCVQYHYSPNFVPTPQITQKGEATVQAAVTGGPTSLGGDFQAAWSPVKNMTIMANYYRRQARFEDYDFIGGTNYQNRTTGFLMEGAIGGYLPFSFGMGALYAGGGYGRSRNDYGLGRIAELTLSRLFIQPTFTYKNDWFRIGMGMRVVMLSFPKGEIDYRIDTDDIFVIQRLERQSPFIFPELGGNIGIHFKPVTISGHLVLVPSQRALEYGFDSSNIGISLGLDLHELGNKKTEKGKKRKSKK
ncbi:MAG: hypothetical protein IT261_02035 [Saprospiraceae bacterium]|nr:hypothetical protein [Saprospiraceae bacterium]